MSLTKKFSTKLDELLARRTNDIRLLVVPSGVGRHKKFSRNIRDKLVDELLSIASEILIKRDAKKEFEKVIRKQKLKKISGHGHRDRGHKLIAWAERQFGSGGPIVYSFWKRKRCLYIGKGASWKRLMNYKRSVYLVKATDIEVFGIRGKSHLGKPECLAKHIFQPCDNEIEPAKNKWGKACPICERHDQMREGIKFLFAMK